MIIVVDANILFSALITPNGQLAKILANPTLPAQRISGHLLLTELRKHQAKIIRSAKRAEDSVMNDMHYFLNNITLFDEVFIAEQHWLEAERLTDGVDHFDINYVALTLQTDGWLWTGDKKLTNHLRALGFDRVLNTTELYELLNIG
jgi:predicted nucleic acid-binding protein